MAYTLLRPCLLKLPAELSHNLTLKLLNMGHNLGFGKIAAANLPEQSIRVMGLEFANPIGLAAGLDKNGDYFNALGNMGFGFIEIGTVTPRAQAGNPQPRLFRVTPEQAIINRMGFNNLGVDYLLKNVSRRTYKGVLGINIGKNKITPEEKAVDDYLFCLRKVYGVADYIVVNVSSPNTPGLRDLQFGDAFQQLIAALKTEQRTLHLATGQYKPIAVKIAPDMDQQSVAWVANTLLTLEVDGVVATNTTVSREGVKAYPEHKELGGLSGKPLASQSTQVVRWLRDELQGKIPIIGVGGVTNAQSAAEKVMAGADLLQLYSGLVYKGPELLNEALDGYLAAKYF